MIGACANLTANDRQFPMVEDQIPEETLVRLGAQMKA